MFKRIRFLIASKLSAAVGRAEDPAEILDYSYEKQRGSLQTLRASIADVATARRRLELEQRRLEQRADKLHSQAQAALAAGNEDLARVAIERRLAILSEVEQTAVQVGELAEQQGALVAKQHEVRRKLEAFRTRKEVVKAQYVAAQAQVRIAEASGGIDGEFAQIGMAVQRADDKVQAMRARAEAMHELEQAGAFDDVLSLTGGDELDRKIAQLGAAAQVEQELAAMKAHLEAPSAHAELPAVEQSDA